MSEVLDTNVDSGEDTDFEIPEDYAAFEKWRETGEVPEATEEAPTAGTEEEAPSSESSEAEAEDGQIAAESDPEEEAEQVEGEPEPKEKDTRLSRRMRKLTGTIAELQNRLDRYEKPEAEEEVTEEAASSPEPVEEPNELVRPMLRDFEDDTEGDDPKSAFDKYEESLAAYNETVAERKIAAALEKQRNDLEEKHARETAQTDWNKAASRFPDYNEVVRDEVKISSAMESVMRMDPEAGTELAYYLGQHPDESERIAKATIAANEKQWGPALARAGMLLGEIRAKLTPPGKKPAAPVKEPAATTAPKPQPKKVSTANRPPAQIRGKNVPQTDVNDDDTARNYAKWEKAREAQLRKK